MSNPASGRVAVSSLIMAVVLLGGAVALLIGPMLLDDVANEQKPADERNDEEGDASRVVSEPAPEPAPASLPAGEISGEGDEPPAESSTCEDPSAPLPVTNEGDTGIRGRVVNDRGEPVAGIAVLFEVQDGWTEGRPTLSWKGFAERKTDEHGGVFLALEREDELRRSYRVSVPLDSGWIGWRQLVYGPAEFGEVRDISEMRIFPGLLHGIVANPEGEPIAEATVHARYIAETGSVRTQEVSSDAHGQFRIPEVREAQVELTASHPLYLESQTIQVDAPPGAREYGPVKLELARASALEVAVYATDGTSIEGASVHCDLGARPGALHVSRAKKTDERGYAFFPSIEQAYARVRVEAEGYVTDSWGTELDAAEKTPQQLHVTLHRSAGIRGRIVNAEGNPREDFVSVSVSAVREANALNTPRQRSRYRIGDDGTFEIEGLLPVPSRLQAWSTRATVVVSKGQRGPYALQPGTMLDVGDVVFADTGSVVVDLAKADGSAIQHLTRVRAVGYDHETRSRMVEPEVAVQARGTPRRARLLLPHGTYRIGVDKDGYNGAQPEKVVEVEPGDRTRISLELGIGGTVFGVVRSRSDDPVPHAPFALVSADGHVQKRHANEDGTFKIRNVAEGRYHLRAGAGYRDSLAGTDFVVVAGERVEQDVHVPAETTDLALRVLTSRGDPVSAATITLALYEDLEALFDSDDATESKHAMRIVDLLEVIAEARTDDEGAARFRALPTGRKLIALVEPTEGDKPDIFLLGALDRDEPSRILRTHGDTADEQSGSILGSVTRHRNDTVVRGARVRAYRLDVDGASLFRVEARTDATGEFRLGGLASGTYRLEVRAAGHATEVETVEVSVGVDTQVRLEMHVVGYLLFDVDAATFTPGAKIQAEARIEGQPHTRRTASARIGELLIFDDLQLKRSYRVRIRGEGLGEHVGTYTARSHDTDLVPISIAE